MPSVPTIAGLRKTYTMFPFSCRMPIWRAVERARSDRSTPLSKDAWVWCDFTAAGRVTVGGMLDSNLIAIARSDVGDQDGRVAGDHIVRVDAVYGEVVHGALAVWTRTAATVIVSMPPRS
jgi:hypothetical protein